MFQFLHAVANVLIVHTTLSYALLINFTIDDELGDSQSGQGPIYTPQQAWLLGNKTQRHLHNPTGHRVDPNFAFDQTWHQTTYNPSNDSSTPPNISVTFRGSAVYVYNILVGPISLQFFLDDDPGYNFSSSGVSSTQYRALVFSKLELPDKEHTLIIATNPTQISQVLFDYVVYTEEISTTSSMDASLGNTAVGTMPSSTMTVGLGGTATSLATNATKPTAKVGAAVGASVGVLVTVLLSAFGIFMRKRGLSLHPFKWSRRDSPGRASAASLSTTSSIVCPYTPRNPEHSPASPAQSSPWRRSMIAPQRHRQAHHPLSPATPLPYARAVQDKFSFDPPLHHTHAPAPALTATGSEHTTRFSDLTEQIRALEATMREIQGEDKKGYGQSQELPRDGNMSLKELKRRVRRLRQELENERRLMDEALPSDGKW